MGLLDDAIREHLDLKRRHGASEAELRRQEAEALGPARRPAPVEEEHEPEEASEPAEAHEAPTMLDEEPAAAAPAALGDELAAAPDEEEGEEERQPEEEPVLPADEEHVEPPAQLAEAEPDEVPSEEALGGPQRREYAQGDPLLEEAESEDARPEGGEEDVLEETPDFLQETPEHDRLWFEQRPPRDFDFD
jgi:hypothetical protein